MDSSSTSAMLPAFLIRDLHIHEDTNDSNAADEALLQSHTSHLAVVSIQAARNRDFDGVIQLKAQEYDGILSKCQAAALRYIDEDDGEIVKVGHCFLLLLGI